MPALQPYLIEPIWEQFRALLPKRETNHPLGCHRPRISDRTVFEKLVHVLVFGCAYRKIADESCSATTLRQRRDEWIELGVIDALREAVLEAYDRYITQVAPYPDKQYPPDPKATQPSLNREDALEDTITTAYSAYATSS